EMMTSLSEVVELSQATLDASLFDIPQGFREVKDSSELYASLSRQSSYGNTDVPSNSGMSQNARNESNVSTTVGAKKAGTVRIGVAGVKTGAVGAGLNATELAGAIQNTLGEYVKGAKIELVQIEADMESGIAAEAKMKECDYVLSAQVSHKKGGGGFGMLSKIATGVGSVIPGATTASRDGQTGGSGNYTAADASRNIKSKDELTLDIKLTAASGAQALARQYKTKAKSDGEDIISPLVQQAATSILEIANQ
ncbi:MAG TPA: hypothetical protein VF721_00480, partial [Pyrinomonadaceae bacterium]